MDAASHTKEENKDGAEAIPKANINYGEALFFNTKNLQI